MRPQMSRQEELQQLKTRAWEIQVRLDFLEMRINSISRSTPTAPQWKAFVDVEKCVGCGICQEVCPVGAVEVDECARIQTNSCIGCGRCVQECPHEALALQPWAYMDKY